MVGTVIVLDEPSPPETFPATNTESGIVSVSVVAANVTSKIIRAYCKFAGKFKNPKVTAAFVVKVW